MNLGEYIGAGSGTTKLLLHLNGNSTDSSGNGNNGTDTNITYSQANGKFGQGAGFNGSSSQIYSQSNDFDFNGTANFTQSIWFKATALPASTKQNHLIMTQEGTTPGTFDKGIQLFSDGSISFYVFDGAVKYALSSASVIDVDNWYNAIGTYDGTNIRIYINGTLKATLAASSSYNFTSPRIVLSHYLSPNILYFNGSIDEVIIENVAWTPQQVAKYYTNSLGRFATL